MKKYVEKILRCVLLTVSGPLKCEEAKPAMKLDLHRFHRKAGRRHRHESKQTKQNLNSHWGPLLAAPATLRVTQPIRPLRRLAYRVLRNRHALRPFGSSRRHHQAGAHEDGTGRRSFLICPETRDVNAETQQVLAETNGAGRKRKPEEGCAGKMRVGNLGPCLAKSAYLT